MHVPSSQANLPLAQSGATVGTALHTMTNNCQHFYAVETADLIYINNLTYEWYRLKITRKYANMPVIG